MIATHHETDARQNDSALPLVSCIMPTYNRRAFVPLAVAGFLDQDYGNLELIVVDDGTDPVADCLPDDPRIRYVRLDERKTVGAKRNLACNLAHGEFIAHWDDDDWYPSRRIRDQMQALISRSASLSGSSQIYFVDERVGAAWHYSYSGGRTPWVVGSTLLYRRDRWAKKPFPNIQVGEDSRFVWDTDRRNVVDLADPTLCVAAMHAGNTTAKRPRGPFWRPTPLNEVRALQRHVSLAAPLSTALHVDQGRATALASPGHGGDARPSDDHTHGGRQWSSPTAVTVSLPFYRCRPYVRRAVDSILNQTHRDLTLVVVNDGDPEPPWDLLANIDDPRLVRFDLSSNRGRYFADAVVLGATITPYFAIQDADDWSDSKRFEVLLRTMRVQHAECVCAPEIQHRPAAGRAARGTPQHLPLRLELPVPDTFSHRLSHHGLFLADALRRLGGPYGGFSLGYDTLLMNLVAMTSRVALANEPLYHRLIRPDSLVHSAATGLRSSARAKAVEELREMYIQAYRWYRAYTEGSLEHDDFLGAVRVMIEQRLTADDRACLQEASEHLHAVLIGARREQPATTSASPRIVTAARAPSTERSLPPTMADLTKTLSWRGWAIEREAAERLAERLAANPPRRVIEIGSGNSTIVLAAMAAQHGFAVVSLEHDPQYFAATRHLLARFGLENYVDLRLSPLRHQSFQNRRVYSWYDVKLDGSFDFAFADGPPEKHGREAILFALAPHLDPDAELWIHDAGRAHEQLCILLWKECFEFSQRNISVTGKGITSFANIRMRDLAAELEPILDWSCLGVSMLTGGRPDLLRRTLDSLQVHLGPVLDAAHAVVLINGPDAAARRLLQEQPWIDRKIDHAVRRMPVGNATSRLMHEVLKHPTIRYVLHLEDDWLSNASDAQWLRDARRILDTHPRIGQVRLRHGDERVLPYHMVTRKPIVWTSVSSFAYSASAHFTFNPFLMRTSDVRRVFPCDDERHAQVNFLNAGWATAQLLPGVFFHIGEQRSLNQKT